MFSKIAVCFTMSNALVRSSPRIALVSKGEQFSPSMILCLSLSMTSGVDNFGRKPVINEFLGAMFIVKSACILVERRPEGSFYHEQEYTRMFKKMVNESLFVYVRIKVS